MSKIPKIIHQIWIGPKSPPSFMSEWKKLNPDYEYILWDNDKIKNFELKNKKQFDLFGELYHGKSDVLRYEILLKYGGIYIDADCEPLRPLDDFFLNDDFFSCYANEELRGDRLANGIIGCIPKHKVLSELVSHISGINKINKPPFELVGPVLLTQIYNKKNKPGKIYPSYYFLPEFYNGKKYLGDFKPYSRHYWGSTKNLYNSNELNINNPLYRNKNKFSIILTAYKTHNYIEECLDSIYLQDYFENNDEYEVLLGIDNCEETLAVINKISGKYKNLRVFYMLKNMGTYVTSNTLLNLVKYDNIIRFDSDDIMLPNMISEINKNVGIYDLIRFSYYEFKNNENQISGYSPNLPTQGVVCYNKKIIKELGGYKNWPCGADTDLLYRLKSGYKVIHIKKGLFYRRVHNDSLTNNEITGMHTKLRLDISKKLKRGYEYVVPVINDYIEIDKTSYDGIIEYKFLVKKLLNSKGTTKSKNKRYEKNGMRNKVKPEPEKKVEIEKPKPTEPIISKKAIPIKPTKLYIPTEKSSKTQKIHNELTTGRLRKGRGYNPRHKKW